MYKRLNVKTNEVEQAVRNTAIVNPGGEFMAPAVHINTDELISILKAGDVFTKYGRSGNPHKTFVQLSQDEKRIIWKPYKCTCFSRKRYMDTDSVRSFIT
jgi:hypothetical protein